MKFLKSVCPDGRFWIKLDATDIKAALMESVKGIWSGDCNLLNGLLEALWDNYELRLLCLTEFPPNVQMMIKLFQEDYKFLKDELKKSVVNLKKRMNDTATKASEETLKSLNWEQVELAELVEQAAKLAEKYTALLEEDIDKQSQVHRGLVEETLRLYLKNLFKKKRKPAATHVLVIMVSEEKRQSKPYALPVQFIPYHSITDDQIRKFVADIKQKMTDMGMTVVGKLVG